jgi:hypothetical protein
MKPFFYFACYSSGSMPPTHTLSPLFKLRVILVANVSRLYSVVAVYSERNSTLEYVSIYSMIENFLTPPTCAGAIE